MADGRDTVFARTTIHAEAPRTARLELGFSDRARVYLNGRPLFAGDDGYRTRDYRFLGSIGWWDAVYLPLEAGENERRRGLRELRRLGPPGPPGRRATSRTAEQDPLTGAGPCKVP